MRVKWYKVFDINDGVISPKVAVNIVGGQMTPGINFMGSGSFGGVNHLSKHVGKDLDVEQDKETGVLTINGFY